MWTERSNAPLRVATLLALAALAGCEGAGLAPIEQKSTSALRKAQAAPSLQSTKPAAAPAAVPATHKVAAGETLYAIAWRYGLDARDLGRWNQLDDFNRIFIGQELRLRAPPSAPQPPSPLAAPRRVETPPVVAKVPAPTSAARSAAAIDASGPVNPPTQDKPAVATREPAVAGKQATTRPADSAPAEEARTQEAKTAEKRDAARNAGGVAWQWPTSGAAKPAKAASGAAGLDIKGSRGQSVVAAADGQVVYSGNGLRGYGQLIIVKHDDTFLSAYAHNDKLLVGEGARVKAGQPIAHMGDTEADEVMLHFEIRKNGIAVDPAQYLPAR